MMGFPVRVIAMSWKALRSGGVNTEGRADAANRGRADEQHLCMAMALQRRRDCGSGEWDRGGGDDSDCGWRVTEGRRSSLTMSPAWLERCHAPPHVFCCCFFRHICVQTFTQSTIRYFYSFCTSKVILFLLSHAANRRLPHRAC